MEFSIGAFCFDTNGLCTRFNMKRVCSDGEVIRNIHIPHNMEVRIGGLGLNSNGVVHRIHMECVFIYS